MDRRALLVPLDGSSLADAALPYAEAIASATGAPLRLLAVVERESPGLERWPDAIRTYMEEARHKSLAAHLAATGAELRDRSHTVGATVVVGDPVDEILAAAHEPDVAMTVMATRGQGGLQRLIVGSVADKVMRMSARPVLLVRPAGDAPPQAAPLRRLMAPLDGSPLAENAVPIAAGLARAAGATLTLVRVEPFVTAGSAPYDTVPDFTRLEDDVARAAEEYLARVRRGLPGDLRVECVILRGFSAASLVEFAERERVDLVVMTTHGRGGLRRLALGSTADRMVRSGVPTLLVRGAVPEEEAIEAAVVAYRCEGCGRSVGGSGAMDERCPRCERHLHACANCVFWDTTGCVLQRPEAFTIAWPGRGCSRFHFRATPAPADAPRVVEVGVA